MTKSSGSTALRSASPGRVSRYYLGIETSGAATGVALIDADQIVFESSVSGMNHNEVLPGLVADALNSARIGPIQLKGISATIGPGMFTALRVGLAYAKGLALPYSIPVKGVSTLLALAQTAAEATKCRVAAQASEHAALFLALIDAKKQQVYCGLYSDKRPLLEPSVVHPEELPDVLRTACQSCCLTLCGSGASLCAETIRQAGFEVRLSGVELPLARVVARLGQKLILEQGGDDLAGLVPLYLRRTDAELQREKR
ncbi:MAG: tRNA (adenosine(37)-N6)-threonylcarbamoyltransferase complex dimerization subunit type 1 TsaB [candidate division WOR-3 bacterium]